MLTTDDIIKLGFEPIPHFTITNSHVYDIGRNRKLSIGDVGNSNEMMWIYEVDEKDKRIVKELVNIHNFDYDGYLSINKVTNILNIFK